MLFMPLEVAQKVKHLEWMLLTTEVVADIQTALRILHWYTYRWRVEEYHKILSLDVR